MYKEAAMTEKFIAITTPGKEFCFRKSSMIAVPTSSAQSIAKTLTEQGYKIKTGETWFVYDNDWYYNDMITCEIKRNSRKSIKVYSYCG